MTLLLHRPPSSGEERQSAILKQAPAKQMKWYNGGQGRGLTQCVRKGRSGQVPPKQSPEHLDMSGSGDDQGENVPGKGCQVQSPQATQGDGESAS